MTENQITKVISELIVMTSSEFLDNLNKLRIRESVSQDDIHYSDLVDIVEGVRGHCIDCTSKDGLNHMCVPWHNTTLCGEVVTKKNVRGKFSCWECNY